MSNHIDQERELFEAWFQGYSLTVRMNGGSMNYAQMLDAWLACASQPNPRVALPDYYVLAPIEPTQEMHDAGRAALAAGIVPMETVYKAMLAAAPHPVSGEQKPSFGAEWVIKILNSGEFRLTRFQYDKSLTHEANTRAPWQIERQTAPFCDSNDVSFWRGNTAEQALMAAIWALFPASARSMGIPYTVCALAARRAQQGEQSS